jgi:nitrate/nitrite transport system ATP-binding protein
MVAFPRNWLEISERVNRIDIFGQAARDLGLPDTGRDRHAIRLFDGITFDPDHPLAYLDQLTIKRDLKLEEILI